MRIAIMALTTAALTAGCVGGFEYRDAEPLPFSQLEYGFPVEYALDDPRVAYVDAGTGPETLILIHGLASNAGFWRENIAGLAEEYRVIAVDLPGYGRSEKDASYPYALSWQADVIRRLIQELELEQVTVVGHSMGGQIAMVLALQHPEVVDRLVLASPAGVEAFAPGEAAWLRGVYSIEAIRKAPEDAIRRNLALNFYNWSDRYEWMVEERARLARDDGFDLFGDAVIKSVAAMVNEPTTPYLDRVDVPTLIVYGEYDGLIPNPYLHPGRTADVFGPAAELMGAALVEIEDAGHLVMMERPTAFNRALLDWLEGR